MHSTAVAQVGTASCAPSSTNQILQLDIIRVQRPSLHSDSPFSYPEEVCGSQIEREEMRTDVSPTDGEI